MNELSTFTTVTSGGYYTHSTLEQIQSSRIERRSKKIVKCNMEVGGASGVLEFLVYGASCIPCQSGMPC